MGDYYNPDEQNPTPELMEANGRELSTIQPRERRYEELTGKLASNELLIGLYSVAGTIHTAPVLETAADFDYFEGQYKTGRFTERTYWAVPRDKVYPPNE